MHSTNQIQINFQENTSQNHIQFNPLREKDRRLMAYIHSINKMIKHYFAYISGKINKLKEFLFNIINTNFYHFTYETKEC